MAGFSSQPPVETMAAIFTETNYSAGLDVEALDRVAKHFNELSPHRKQDSGPAQFIDPGILVHQIPGGMISNFKSQLSTQKALDKLPEVLDEVSRVREDLGYPPLVTPTSQIVGTQAVMNILAGERFKIVPNEVKDYIRGKYGRSPVPIDKAFIKKILGDEKPIDHRPADELSPMLPHGADSVDPKFIEHEEDIISYILLPEPALQFFQWRALPPEQRPDTPADLEIKRMRAEQEKGTSEMEIDKEPAVAPQPSSSINLPMNIPDVAREVLDKIEGLKVEELVFRKGNSTIAIRPSGIAVPQVFDMSGAATDASQSDAPPVEEDVKEEVPAEKPTESGSASYSETIDAPFVGTLYLAPGPGKDKFIKEGDEVEAGDKVCIVEAMKLFNEITAPKKCRIVKIIAIEGEAVEKGQPLIGIEGL
jgi:oxaloacetate decarboxylase alpha subunit